MRFLWVGDTSKGFPQIAAFQFARVVFGIVPAGADPEFFCEGGGEGI